MTDDASGDDQQASAPTGSRSNVVVRTLPVWVGLFRQLTSRDIVGPTGGPKKYPSMPKAQWRRAAVWCLVVGAAICAILAGALTGFDGSRMLAAAIVGGALSIAVGMYAVETLWLRQLPDTADRDHPASSIR